MIHSTKRRPLPPVPRGIGLSILAAGCLASAASAQATQIVFGVTSDGATISTLDTATSTPITEADVLRAPFGLPTFGPMPAPQIFLNGANLGLSAYTGCVGHAPGVPCRIEVDALSFGTDKPFNLLPPGTVGRARIYFSVDRFATGVPGSGVPPNVLSEGFVGTTEAAADVFTVIGTIGGPLPPQPVPGRNTAVIDGNGLPSSAGSQYRGLGLREIGQPAPFDNLDALHIGVVPTGPGAFVYFSLDGAIVDPLTGQANSDSASLQGVSPSAILRRSISGGGITVFATAAQLGLHPQLDDLDALILSDNGNGTYQPSTVDYDWLSSASDMVLFSVRRGSAIVGVADSRFGLPIEPGDLLQPPLSPGLAPRIFIAAENLGLRTERSFPGNEGDELDALATATEPFTDCNNNGRDDGEDIALGSSSDTNNNNIPDECEQDYNRYCECVAPNGPCGNDDPTAGCKNSTGVGGLLCGVGTTSITTDDLTLAATQMTAFAPSLFFRGQTSVQLPFGDGLRCVGNPTYRMGIVIADGTGTANFGPGIVAASVPGGPPGEITLGSTWKFQTWYRDSAVYCTPSTFNLTNGLSVVFSP